MEPFPTMALMRAHQTSAHAKAPPTVSASSADSQETDDVETAPRVPGDIAEELEPKAPRRSLREWITGRRPPAVKDKAPKRKREYTGELIGTAWGGFGSLMARSGFDVPVGRCLMYQQAVAGELLDGLVADSVFDRGILQPLARNRDNAEALGALVALPALVFMYERASDETRGVIAPWMEEAVRAHLVAMMPVIKKKQARDRELAKVIAEAKAEGLIDEELGDAQDVVVRILDGIFAGLGSNEPPVDGEVIIPEEVRT